MNHTRSLGDRMKRYEAAFAGVLPRRTYTIIRVDGRAFHAYLRGAARPYDEAFMADMDAVSRTLCEEITGARLAYVQSDEISILVTDFANLGTEPWFGGVTAKVISLSAAIATAALNERRPGRALFDSRAFTLSDPVEVANYFVWRQRDATHNSISMTARAYFSQRRLHGLSTDDQVLLLAESGVDWNAQPEGFKWGRTTVRETGRRQRLSVDERTGIHHYFGERHGWWETAPAEPFAAAPNTWLAAHIPPLPTLTPPAAPEAPAHPAPGPARGTETCGSTPPDLDTWGDCWCTLLPEHDGPCVCEPCRDRHGAPGWQNGHAATITEDPR